MILVILIVSLSKVAASGISYYLKPNKDEHPLNYYDDEPRSKQSSDGRVIGYFFGGGAEKLGLSGPIYENDLNTRALFSGIDPNTGEQLRQGACTVRIYGKATDRERVSRPVGAYDFTFSAPKPVSVIWALGSDKEQKAILDAHRDAVNKVLTYIERNYSTTRVGKGGVVSEKAFPTFAVFVHRTSREGDSHLHSHALLMNAVIRENGKGGAIDARQFFQLQHRLGQMYRDELARQLNDRLGLHTIQKPIRNGFSFDIEGVPQKLCDTFSKRRQQIEAEVQPGDSSKQVQVAVLKTRKPKDRSISLDELRQRWRSEAERIGFDAQKFFRNARWEQRCQKSASPLKPNNVSCETPHAPVTAMGLVKWAFVRVKAYSKAAMPRLEAEKTDLWDKKSKSQELRSKRLKFLRATGCISQKTYQKLTSHSKVLKTRLGPEVMYALGRISKKQKNFFLSKYGHKEPGFGMPKSRWGINLSHATYQISDRQRQFLLSLNEHENRHLVFPSFQEIQIRAARELVNRNCERLNEAAQEQREEIRTISEGDDSKTQEPIQSLERDELQRER